jgi:2-octaprenyl-6-methoxyphenol hydroxylase
MSLKKLLGRQVPDCAIIGGGPVGLIFAILSRTSIGKVQIFESKKYGYTNQDNRALALSNGSRLILEEIGVWDRLEKKITKIKKIHTSQAGSFGRTMLDAEEFNEESLGYIISYGDLMRALQEEVECIRNVEISYETKVTKCSDKEASLNLTLQTNNKTKKFKSEGIEGLELNKKTKHFNHAAIVTKVLSEMPHRNIAYERFTSNGPIALLPNKEDKFSLVWTGPLKFIEDLKKLDNECFLSQLHESFGDRVGSFEECEKRISFDLKQTHVKVMHANIVALGNASQTMHPVAGQGLNTGFRDAYQLSQSLRDDLNTKNLETLINDYKQSRASERKKILGFTELLVKSFSNDLVGFKKARGYALTLLDISKPIKQSFVRKMSYGE